MHTAHFCSHCGAGNAPGALFCRTCLQALDAPGTLPEKPRVLNQRYEVLAELGTGGFGAVYKARDTQVPEKVVAVKQINLQGLSSQEIIEATSTFNREAEILSSLSHPLLPDIFDRFSDSERWYLVMTFIDGQTLEEYVEERLASPLPGQPGLPLNETLAIALQLCDGLAYLHAQQPPVIFRDLKPSNIMYTRSGRLYLIDFGIARRFKPGQARDTIPLGSPGFAAPEQYGRAQTTPQADIYSLGALCSFLISGNDPSEHPFHFPPLQFSRMDGLDELDALIQRMVALDSARRPADIFEVRNELQRISQQAWKQPIWLPPEGQTPPAAFSPLNGKLPIAPFSPQSLAGKTSRRSVLTASLVVGGVLLTGGLATYWRSHQPQSGQNGTNSVAVSQSTAEGTATDPTASQMAAVPVPLNGATYWSQDLRYAAVANPNRDQIALYKVQGRQLLQTLNAPAFSSVQWSLDNRKILATSDDGRLKIWNTQNGQGLFTFASPATRFTLRASWSPDGRYCAISYLVNGIDPYVALLRVSDGKELFHMNVPGYISSNNGNTLAWSPDSNYLAFPDSTNAQGSIPSPWTADIWERETFQKVRSFNGGSTSSGYISSISWSPGGKQLALVINHDLWLSQFDSSQPASFLAQNSNDTINYGPCWSPDEKFLAVLAVFPPGTVLPSGNLTVWDTSNGQTVQFNGNGSQDLVAFAWSPDSKRISAVDNLNVLSQWTLG